MVRGGARVRAWQCLWLAVCGGVAVCVGVLGVSVWIREESCGRVVWHEGKLDVAAGSGRFIAMPPFAPSLFGVAPTRAPRHEVEARRYGTVPVQRPSASGEAASSAAPHAEL